MINLVTGTVHYGYLQERLFNNTSLVLYVLLIKLRLLAVPLPQGSGWWSCPMRPALAYLRAPSLERWVLKEAEQVMLGSCFLTAPIGIMLVPFQEIVMLECPNFCLVQN